MPQWKTIKPAQSYSRWKTIVPPKQESDSSGWKTIKPPIKPTPQQYVQPKYESNVPNWLRSVDTGLRNFSRAADNAPRFSFAEKIKNPIGKVVASIPQSILNIPSNLVDVVFRGYGEKQTPTDYLRRAAEAAKVGLDIGALGGTSAVAKGLAEQGAKEAGLRQVLKTGAISGAKQGAGFGAGYGALNAVQNNKPILRETATGALGGGLLGGVLGGATSGAGRLIKGSPKGLAEKRQLASKAIEKKPSIRGARISKPVEIPKELTKEAVKFAKQGKSAEEFEKDFISKLKTEKIIKPTTLGNATYYKGTILRHPEVGIIDITQIEKYPYNKFRLKDFVNNEVIGKKTPFTSLKEIYNQALKPLKESKPVETKIPKELSTIQKAKVEGKSFEELKNEIVILKRKENNISRQFDFATKKETVNRLLQESERIKSELAKKEDLFNRLKKNNEPAFGFRIITDRGEFIPVKRLKNETYHKEYEAINTKTGKTEIVDDIRKGDPTYRPARLNKRVRDTNQDNKTIAEIKAEWDKAKPVEILKKITKTSPLSEKILALKENKSRLGQDVEKTRPILETLGHKEQGAKSKPYLANREDISYIKSVASDTNDVKKKVGLHDLFATPKYVLQKIGLGKQAEKLDRAYEQYKMDVEKEIGYINKLKNSSNISSKNVFKWLDGQKVALTPQEKKVGTEIKNYLSNWADKLGLPEDKRISHYITHIFDRDFIKKEFDPELAKLITRKPAGSVYDPFLQKRLGKMGYREDVWSALSAYVKRAARKYNLDPVLKELKESAKTQPLENANYIAKLTHGINMRPTEFDNYLDNTIKQVIGYKFGQRPTTTITRAIRQQIYRGGLGLNVGSALKNLSQGINTYAELGEKYTAKGYLDLLLKGTKELKATGVLENGLIEDKALPVYKSLLQKADKTLFYLFEKAEMINRGSAYYGAKAKALAKGMSEKEAIAYAKNIVAKTQFKFGGAHTPVALNSDLMKTLTQFQTFSLKQAEFIGNKIKNKEIASLLRYIGATMAVYGLVGKSIGWDWKDISIPSFRFSSPATSIVSSGYNYITAQGDKYKQAKARRDLLKSGGLLIPAGGQLKKTIEGYGAYKRRYSQTPSGNVRFPVPQTPRNAIQASVLGQWSLPQAKTYFSNKTKPLGKNQTKIFQQRGIPYYNRIISERKKRAEEKKRKELLKALRQNKKTYYGK